VASVFSVVKKTVVGCCPVKEDFTGQGLLVVGFFAVIARDILLESMDQPKPLSIAAPFGP
jgi:hypothetical protein